MFINILRTKVEFEKQYNTIALEHLVKLFSKFSKYEILNHLIPGVVLCYMLRTIGYPIWGGDWTANIIVAYFVGMVCSRFSSLCIEEPFKKFKWIEWREYEKYNKAKTERPFIALLQENANMYRSLAGAFVIALVAIGYYKLRLLCPFFIKVELPVLVLLLALLYIFSYRKQINDYVVKNIDEVNKEKNE